MPDDFYPPPFEDNYPDPGPITPVPIDIELPYPVPGPETEPNPQDIGYNPLPDGAPGEGGPSINMNSDGAWDALAKVLGVAGSTLKTTAQALGLVSRSGGLDLSGIMALVGTLFAGNNASNASAAATKMLQEGAEKANTLASEQINGARVNFDPYITAGKGGLEKMSTYSNPLAGKFVSAGPQSNMATKFQASPLTLGALAKR